MWVLQLWNPKPPAIAQKKSNNIEIALKLLHSKIEIIIRKQKKTLEYLPTPPEINLKEMTCLNFDPIQCFNIYYSFDSTEICINSKLTHLPYDKGKNDRNWTKGSNADMILVTYLKWFGSHRTLPVGLIAKHCAKITDNINESKYESTWKFKFR